MMSSVGRPREHDERTGAALLDAAEQIAAAEGADAISVRRVAQRAGTTTRAVYSLYGSKEGLLIALGNRAFEILGAGTRDLELTDDPVADLVNGSIWHFRRWTLDHPALFRIGLLREEIPADLAERFRPARLEALGNLVAWLGRALGLTGGLSNPKLMEATTQFDAMCEGLAMLERRGAIPQGMEEKIWRDGLHALIAGLRANTGATAEESAGPRRPEVSRWPRTAVGDTAPPRR